jgi:class 3 adenylate cyclase
VEAAVLFADVAGFTPISERLALIGPLGTEELTRILNQTFATLIAQVVAHGGSVARFSGDALGFGRNPPSVKGTARQPARRPGAATGITETIRGRCRTG